VIGLGWNCGVLWEGFKIWKKDVFGGREALLFEFYLGRQGSISRPDPPFWLFLL
jgi:hypothetical protein